MDNKQPHIGIMVQFIKMMNPPFLEHKFFQFLTQVANKKGMQVTVFSPTKVDWHLNCIEGYRWQENKWVKGYYPIPSLIYDRIFYDSLRHIKNVKPWIQRLQEEHQTVLLGKGLPGKWKVYQMLKESTEIKSHLPETYKWGPRTPWKKLFDCHQQLFMKPTGGSHGKGAMKISKAKGGQVKIDGRNFLNKTFTKTFSSLPRFQRWLNKNIQQRPYIVQPYLSLCTKEGVPFDIRLLVQKDETGQWKTTGQAIRQGKKDGLTSNLHGGGTALDASIFLNQYALDQRQHIEQQLETIQRQVPPYLEKKHGPLVELGIDIGIDQQQHVWLLEVNSKPGRQSFQIANNQMTFIEAMAAPILYAEYLSRTLKGV